MIMDQESLVNHPVALERVLCGLNLRKPLNICTVMTATIDAPAGIESGGTARCYPAIDRNVSLSWRCWWQYRKQNS